MRRALFHFGLVVLLAACSSTPPRTKAPSSGLPPPSAKGGYYLDDGPGENPPANFDLIADAVPRAEPLHRYANRQYVALGQSYVPDAELRPYRAEGLASWYGRRFHGKKTASGELYDMYAMTAAHRTLPIPSYARVTSLDNGKSVIVRINDRGPFHRERIIDLSYTAAHKLGYVSRGHGRVVVESIDPASFNIQGGQLGPGHYVQLGAFSKPDNAMRLRLRAQEALGLSDVQSHVTLVGEMHRVNLGPFPGVEEASGWVERARAVLGVEAAVIVR